MSKISLSTHFPLAQLKGQADHKNILSFPKVPCHSQAIERVIQLVIKVSSRVRSYRRRHQEILSKLFHCRMKARGYPIPKGQKSKKSPVPPRTPRPIYYLDISKIYVRVTLE